MPLCRPVEAAPAAWTADGSVQLVVAHFGVSKAEQQKDMLVADERTVARCRAVVSEVALPAALGCFALCCSRCAMSRSVVAMLVMHLANALARSVVCRLMMFSGPPDGVDGDGDSLSLACVTRGCCP